MYATYYCNYRHMCLPDEVGAIENEEQLLLILTINHIETTTPTLLLSMIVSMYFM